MTEIKRIIDQLNRAFVGEAWHGPAVIEILEGVTTQQGRIAILKKAFNERPAS